MEGERDLHAVILAGGKGTRLRPYTTVLPKPLVPIGDDCAVLEIVLRQLSRQGFRSATLTIGHLASLIQAYVGDGSQWGIEVTYAVESEPLGTIGPVARILDTLPDHFLVLNGDVLTDLDFAALLRGHVASGLGLTVATYQRETTIDFGVMEVDRGRIVGFREKPSLDWSVSMGVYGISRATLDHVPKGVPFGFDDLMHLLIERGDLPASHLHTGYWLDIGRPEDYERANRDFESLRPVLLPDS
jgi:NDP-sugar pyrophosphorylase family protein